MSTITNIPINTRSMNGIITISDGTATLENGNLSNLNNLDATTMTTTTQPVGTSNTSVATTAFVAIGFVSKTISNIISANNTFTGILNDFTLSTTTVKNQTISDNSNNCASTNYVQSQGYAPLAGTSNIFTGSNTFQNQLTCSGIVSDDLISVKRAPGSTFLTFQDTTNLTTITYALANNIASVFTAATSSIYNIICRDASNITRTVLSLSYAQCTFTSSNPIVQTGTMPGSGDSTTKVPTTAWVQSRFATLFSSANTFTNLQTFSRTAGNTNIRLFDSSNSSQFTGAVNNNQINLIMSNNDSKIYFNTLSPLGIQSDTLLINTTTSTFNCTNPLVQTATMPAFTTSSNQTPTMAWVQGAIGLGSVSLLSTNNIWSGSNDFSISYPTISVATLASTDATTAISTNKWVQTVITALKAATNTWSGVSNTFSNVIISNKHIQTTTSSPGPSSSQIGDMFRVYNYILPSTFNFNTAWTGAAPNIGLYSYLYDNSTNNRRYGTYRIDCRLVYTNSVATITLGANINNGSATSTTSQEMQTIGPSTCMLIGTDYYYTVNFSYTMQVYTNTTFYLNCLKTGGGTGGFTADSYIQWTRIA